MPRGVAAPLSRLAALVLAFGAEPANVIERVIIDVAMTFIIINGGVRKLLSREITRIGASSVNSAMDVLSQSSGKPRLTLI